MPEISLTDFVDVVSRSGLPKATKIAEIKNRPAYNPATDFYKPLREGIVDIHHSNQTKRHLDFLMSSITDEKKIANYPDVIKGYKKWWGTKNLTWFAPPKTKHTRHGIAVTINPELGLSVNGTRHIIKLYLKSDHMSRLRMDIVTELLSLALTTAQPGDVLGLLDVRCAKLFSFVQSNTRTRALIDAELAYIASIWPNL